MTATFNLLGTAPGICDVVATNANGAVIRVSQGFTVQDGGAPDLRIAKTGTTPVPGSHATYTIALTNVGSVDATDQSVAEFLEPAYTLVSVAPAAIADIETLAQNQIVVWNLPRVPAGQTTYLSYRVNLDPNVGHHCCPN